jgi:hypothetical protein
VTAFLPDAKCLGGWLSERNSNCSGGGVQVLKVIIFPGPVEASTDSSILISLWTPVHKKFILAACILCGTSI